jgi:DNA-binding MarR family transcriptional regulator
MKQSRTFPHNTEDINLRDVTTYHVGSLESSAHRSIRAYKDACLKKYGLTGMQWYIIGTLYDAGSQGMRITDLSKSLGTTLGFMTNSINLLASKEIVERIENSSDNRSKIVVLADSYYKTCRIIEDDLRNQLRKSIYKNITQEELKSYIKTLRTLSMIDDGDQV